MPVEPFLSVSARLNSPLALEVVDRAEREQAQMDAWQKETGAITPMFSRTEGAEPASDRRQAVEALVQQIASRWSNAPEVVVVDSMEDERVPKAVRDYEKAQQSKGASGAPEGFFFGGKVYLVAGQLGGDADVLRVLFHEALGHFGLRGTFGPELGTILDRLAVLNAAKVRAKAKQYGLDYDKPSDRRAAAEEVLAEMAQRTPDIGWGKKAIAAIRTWLRLHVPGFRKMAMSDAELVRSYILPARAFVQRGGPNGGPGGGMQFSRAPLSKREKERYEQLLTDPFLEGRKETKQEMAELSRLRDKLAKHEDAQDRQAEGSQAAFSRSIGDAVRDFSQQGARNAFMDAVTSHGSTNLWIRTVGTQYHKAQRNPETFGPVFDGVQDYIIKPFSMDEVLARVASLLADPGIVRNRLKVTATISNAQAFLALQASGQSFYF